MSLEQVSFFAIREPKTLLRVVKEGSATQSFVATPSDPQWRPSHELAGIDVKADELLDLTPEEAQFILGHWAPAPEQADDPMAEIVKGVMVAVDEMTPVPVAVAPVELSLVEEVVLDEVPFELEAPAPVMDFPPVPSRLERDEVMSTFRDLEVSRAEPLPAPAQKPAAPPPPPVAGIFSRQAASN